MLVLIETAGGYALFKVQNSKLLQMDATELANEIDTQNQLLSNNVALHAFKKFKETKEAVTEANALMDSTIGVGLQKFLKKNIVKPKLLDKLAVSDKGLVVDIKNKLGIDVLYSSTSNELIRGIRSHLHELITGISEKDTKAMALSLSHSLSRFKLKFSPDKVDTMIVQAIGLLDDLDRELNNFAMRLKEWYGWHFPELHKIVTDNMAYAKTVKLIGFRNNTQNADLSMLGDSLAEEVKQSAEISMGTEITQEDLANIIELADRVEELTEYRASLGDYLQFRMKALAPNLTHMVGELVGARLISHCGSLMNLAKHPSSTVQILGAEKALFRALKTKSQTPKYGLIYHAALVGQTSPKFKGKISRILAAKLSLSIRVDALGDQSGPTVALENKRYVERKLEEIAEGTTHQISRSGSRPAFAKYEPLRSAMKSGSAVYDTSVDAILDSPASSDQKTTKLQKRSIAQAEDISNETEKKAEKPAKKRRKEKV